MGTIILRDCVIFDGHSPELLDGADILIEDREIKEISNRPLKSASAQEINLGGRFLMPGLIDAHFHAYAAHVNLASLDVERYEILAAGHGRLIAPRPRADSDP